MRGEKMLGIVITLRSCMTMFNRAVREAPLLMALMAVVAAATTIVNMAVAMVMMFSMSTQGGCRC